MDETNNTSPQQPEFKGLKPGILCVNKDTNGNLSVSTVKYDTLAEKALKKEQEKKSGGSISS